MYETLERKSLDSVDSGISQLRVKLAEDAKTKLGYSYLASKVGADRPLAKALHKLGIQPFTAKSVNRYKEKMRTAMTVEQHVTRLIGWSVFAGLAFPLAMSLHVGAGAHAALWRIMLAVIGAVVGLALVKFSYSDDEFQPQRTWLTSSFGNYHSVVPDHILQKALEIKQEYPAVNFQVCYMQETERERPPRVHPDPFFEVLDGREKYTVDVWDERDYKEEYVTQF